MRFLRGFVVIVMIFVCLGCEKVEPDLTINVSERANPWTGLNLNNDPDNFQFAIVADRTGGHEPGVFAAAIGKLNLLGPEFVISVGDLIEGYTEDEIELNTQWDEFDGLVDGLDMPFFYVPGNHDIGNEVMIEKWRERFGASYYHFIYRDVLFLCVDTQDPPASGISEQQIEYFRNVLKAHRDVRWTLVFMHQPFWKMKETVKNHRKFEALLVGRNYTVFAGHLHTYDKSVRDGRRYYVLSVTGGNRHEGAHPMDFDKGRFDHIVWVTITDDGPVMANLRLEGILDDELGRD